MSKGKQCDEGSVYARSVLCSSIPCDFLSKKGLCFDGYILLHMNGGFFCVYESSIPKGLHYHLRLDDLMIVNWSLFINYSSSLNPSAGPFMDWVFSPTKIKRWPLTSRTNTTPPKERWKRIRRRYTGSWVSTGSSKECPPFPYTIKKLLTGSILRALGEPRLRLNITMRVSPLSTSILLNHTIWSQFFTNATIIIFLLSLKPQVTVMYNTGHVDTLKSVYKVIWICLCFIMPMFSSRLDFDLN